MRVEWSSPAEASLEEYLDHLQEQRPASRIDAQADIRDSVGRLAVHPFMGRPARWQGLREWSLLRWRKIAVYRVEPDRVRVLAFLDARQDLANVDPDDAT